jgi:hypothetical protein
VPQSPQNHLRGVLAAPQAGQARMSGDPQSLQKRLLSGFDERHRGHSISRPELAGEFSTKTIGAGRSAHKRSRCDHDDRSPERRLEIEGGLGPPDLSILAPRSREGRGGHLRLGGMLEEMMR